jgi:hypothetical protein
LRIEPPRQIHTVHFVLPELAETEETEHHDRAYLCRVKVDIPGRRRKRRNIVEINGQEVELTLTPFRLLLRLILGALEEPDGFVPRGAMKLGGGLASEGYYDPHRLDAALGRLRNPLATALGSDVPPTDFIEVRTGRVRVSTHPRFISWGAAALTKHEDEVVRNLARKLAATAEK